jgi:hypothetical protein
VSEGSSNPDGKAGPAGAAAGDAGVAAAALDGAVGAAAGAAGDSMGAGEAAGAVLGVCAALAPHNKPETAKEITTFEIRMSLNFPEFLAEFHALYSPEY